MPTYEFRCNTTENYFELYFESIAEYERAEILSPYTGTADVTRVIRDVHIGGGAPNIEALMQGDESAISALEQADPSTLARQLRELANQTGEDMGDEFHTIVDRLDAGQAPHEIEQALSDDEN